MVTKPTTTKRLLNIAQSIDLTKVQQAASSTDGRTPQTPVGKAMMEVVLTQEQQKIIDDLNAKLDAAGRGELVRALDPSTIVPGKYANRDPKSLESKEFIELKKEIEHSNGNIQPIKVRPIGEGKFEIVFGHRRHKACLDLGLPVIAMINELDNKKAFIEMDRENRNRENLRPIEVGRMYKAALDDGLFISLRQMADEVGIDASNLSKAMSLAKLPENILAAFPSQLDLQYGDAVKLNAAIQHNPERINGRALEIAKMDPRPSYATVLKDLTGLDITASEPLVISGKSRTAVVKINQIKKTCSVEITNTNPALLELLKTHLATLVDREG